MSLTCRYAAQSCARQLRSSSSLRVSGSLLRHKLSRRHNSTEAVNPKIAGIVDQISQLTLLETADLVASLKVCSLRFPHRHSATFVPPVSSRVSPMFPLPPPRRQCCVVKANTNPRIKSRLNIPDLPVGGFAAAAPAAPAAAEAEAAEDAAPAAAEKTMFTLKLMAFEAGSKPKIIKEVKNLLGLSLVDSKKFVESAPKTMKESVPKDEAEKIVATLKELGATVTME